MSLRRLGALSLSIIETATIFAGIPLLVIVVITGMVYAGGAKRDRRYRPGRPFEFTPVWFLSAPAQASAAKPAERIGGDRGVSGGNRLALGASAGAGAAVEPTGAAAIGLQDPTGGASDRW